MKKLLNVIILVLAMNFLAVVGAAGWLFRSGHMDKAKFAEVKKILFPAQALDTTKVATTQPDATTQPMPRLDELLAKASGRSAAEQVEFIQRTFDVQAAQLDRRERELDDLQQQVDLAKKQMAKDRAKLDEQQKDLIAQRQEATRLASDKGFQDSLQLYTAMQPKQVKEVFMTLSDDVTQEYLEAMEPRTASKIIKEFKTPDEIARIQRVLEKMRKAPAGAVVGSTAASAPVSPAVP